MTFLQNWRRFGFLTRETVQDPDNENDLFLGFQETNLCGCFTLGDFVVCGDCQGSIFLLSSDLAISSVTAYASQLDFAFGFSNNLIGTIGVDDKTPTSEPQILKIWELSAPSRSLRLIRSITLAGRGSSKKSRATIAAVHPSLCALAVGFDDSGLVLYRGSDVTREKTTNNKPRVLRDGLMHSTDGPISILAFVPSVTPNGALQLFVGTEGIIMSYALRDTKDAPVPHVLSRHGCAPSCWVLTGPEMSNQLAIARDDAVYFYQTDCAGQCYVFEGRKILMRCHGSCLAIVTQQNNESRKSDNGANFLLTVYDIPNSYIAHCAPVIELQDIVYRGDSYHAITKLGSVVRLKEIPTPDKMEILYSKNLYDLAISVAKQHGYSSDGIADVFKTYGDYLYNKGDFEVSVQKYVKTIGSVEPSYVVSKFLDAQRIHQLTEYLEALHKTPLATKDHTTILLNCYIKLQSHEKLEKFVKSSVTTEGLAFDVDTAVRVLRSAGFLHEASYLASSHQQHSLYLSLQVESCENYAAAIKYIEQLSPTEAVKELNLYGKVLLQKCPNETISVIEGLCSTNSADDVTSRSPDEFLSVFVDDPSRLRTFLQRMLIVDDGSRRFLNDAVANPVLCCALLELELIEYAGCTDPVDKVKNREKIMGFLNLAEKKIALDQSLILCQNYGFNPGVVYICEKTGLKKELLMHYMDQMDFSRVVETCRTFAGSPEDSEQNKQLWIDALWFCTRNDAPQSCITSLLRSIHELNILTPLMALEILSHSPQLTLNTVKDYLVKWLKSENEKVETDENEIKKFMDEIKHAETTLEDLSSQAQVFQDSRCSVCDHPLEIPTVNFFCKHSFHKQCYDSYADGTDHCPICEPQRRRARGGSELLASYLDSDLQNTRDPIDTVAQHITAGRLNTTETIPRQTSRQNTVETIPRQVSRPKTVAAPPKQKPAPVSLNPFGDDDDDVVEAVSTNPFGEE